MSIDIHVSTYAMRIRHFPVMIYKTSTLGQNEIVLDKGKHGVILVVACQGLFNLCS